MRSWRGRSIEAMLRLQNADWRSYATYLASRPDEAELQAIRLMIRLCRQYRFRLHIVHLSTALALDDLRAARAEGLPITVETCPHYLHFAAEEIADGATLLKCAPPIRSRANRERLWAGLGEGVIDMVVTDHSPCPPEMKRMEAGRFDLAWGGIASLSVALPVMWTDARGAVWAGRYCAVDVLCSCGAGWAWRTRPERWRRDAMRTSSSSIRRRSLRLRRTGCTIGMRSRRIWARRCEGW